MTKRCLGCLEELSYKRSLFGNVKYCGKKCQRVARNKSQAAYRARHPGRSAASQRATRARNPEKFKAASLAWKRANSELVKIQRRNWIANNPNRVRAQLALRRARKLGVPGFYTAEDIDALFERQAGKCFYCKRECKLTVDHVIPLTKPGTSNWICNIVLACSPCNSSKGDMWLLEWECSAYYREHCLILESEAA